MRPRTLCTFVLFLLALLAVPTWSVADHYYETTTTSDMGQQATTEGSQDVTRTRGWVDGPKAKIEFLDGEAGGFMQKGTYLITQDGGETIYFVNPEEQTYSVFDLEAMLAMAGNMMTAMGGMVELEFTDFKNDQLLKQAGESILGYPTTHYRYDTAYTMRMSVMGMTRENRTETMQDMWCTDELDSRGFYVWLRPDKFRTGNKEFDQLIKSEMAKIQGFPLKTTTTTKMIAAGAPETTVVSTMEVTTLEERTVPDSTYEVPEGYSETPMMMGMPGGYQDYMQGQGQPGEDDPLAGLSDLLNRGDG